MYNLGRWAVVREAQRVVALANPAMSLVTAIDQDLGNDPHPLNKFDIAQRLQVRKLSATYMHATMLHHIATP